MTQTQTNPYTDIARRMRQNPDQGTPCRNCGVTAKECQARYIEALPTALTPKGHCCAICRLYGGEELHK